LARSGNPRLVIACDKREALHKGALATKQSGFLLVRQQSWIASLSLSSAAHSRDPLARNDVSASKNKKEK
jgi:hypothetical protein